MFLLNDKVYNALKFLAQVVLPALATLYAAVATIWGLPKAQEVVLTITAVDTFLGLVLGISSVSYKASDTRFDGALKLEEHPDGGTQIRLQQLDEQALLNKGEVTLKVNA